MKKILLILVLLCIPFMNPKAEEVTISVFYGEECPYCAEEEKFLNVLKYQLGDNINIQRYEVWHDEDNSELLAQVREALNNDGSGVPFVIIGNEYFSGYTETTAAEIKKAVFENLSNKNLDLPALVQEDAEVSEVEADENPTIHFSLLGETNVKETSAASIALTEGISDAINLGSLWIILVLFGILLSIYNKKKRWILGSIFVIISTLTYMIFGVTGLTLTVNQTTFIRSFIAVIAIVIAAISIDAHLKINIPQKSILQKLQELFGKKQMLIYIIGIIVASALTTFTLVNQAGSSPALFQKALEIQSITGASYAAYIGLYYLTYLFTSLILFAVANIIVKEIFIENTIGTYNRLISGIVLLVSALILLFVPSIFMMVWP